MSIGIWGCGNTTTFSPTTRNKLWLVANAPIAVFPNRKFVVAREKKAVWVRNQSGGFGEEINIANEWNLLTVPRTSSV